MDRKYNYRDFIHAVKHNKIDEVKRLLPLINPKRNYSKALRVAARSGDISLVKLLLPLSDPKASSSDALYGAVIEGHVDIVKLLLPVSEPSALQNRALRAAASRDETEIAELLLPLSDLAINHISVLQTAVIRNHIPIVKFIIDRGQQGNDFVPTLYLAASFGFTETLQLLLPISTREQLNAALHRAIDHNKIPTVDLLYSVSDVGIVLQKLGPDYPATNALLYLRERFESEKTKTFLNENIQSDNKHSSQAKKM